MKKKLMTTGVIFLVLVILLVITLPTILKLIGLHPDYERVEYDFKGKRALIITTSHDTLGDSGKATGVYGSEMTIPYYEFLDAGMTVDIASIEGGEIPFEPVSLKYPLATSADKRYLKDDEARRKTMNALKIDDMNFLEYDIIYLAGGWGASYDLGYSEVLGVKITEANAEGILLGSVCHGVLGFLKAQDIDGTPLVEGRKMTAVSDKQVEELGITATPMHPETELRKLGADYRKNEAFRDFFATLVVVDGNLVTGQNQNSSGETAQTLLRLLDEKVN
ncbi:MAG: thiamine biosynthesis protein ThiJ [Firmicutes bacterium GWF2_51_9]|nr:MAG: thiamine biosynthesis protein ThiJ [Firmicutes bacterium GWF2_51_9]OGS59331.1 MAG: thiamine biosynthesis protein ThiJ [Firmicutes bacterium GWE2_51_13]HAM62385.1 type 1 glutamine amidotransferase domain-containing protein [Erysipelotrichaceae bacterium]HBZ40288.1 type 1 glutamine amidotransferase domain-containing protein [Erysipelotrichaceae bacterium]